MEKILTTCQGQSDGENCYVKAFGDLRKKATLDHAIQTLAAVQKIDENARGCHFISHAISTAETEKNPDT